MEENRMRELTTRDVAAFFALMLADFGFIAAATNGILNLSFGEGLRLETWAVVSGLVAMACVGVAILLLKGKE